MSRLQTCVTVLCMNLALSWNLVPVHAANRALEIMREVDRRQRSESRSNDGAIEVIDSGDKVLHKNWQFWAQGHSGESKSLIRFTAPAEVRGVGFLTLNHKTGSAEQWLYTPAIQRDRRIAPQEKSSRFMGTDFTNEDMEERSIENYDYDLLAEENFEDQPAYKIKAVYKDREDTSYSHRILWVRKDIMATTFTELYKGSKLVKTLRWSDWQEIQGTWTPHFIEMKDLMRGSATRIRVSNVQYNFTFPDDWFSLRNLRRGS
jgi:outer membrane lipoprotein-sorting protein